MPDVDPDQLLKELDAKLALMRAKRRSTPGINPAVRVAVMAAFGVVLILVLWGLQVFLSEMIPKRSATPQAPMQAGAGAGK